MRSPWAISRGCSPTLRTITPFVREVRVHRSRRIRNAEPFLERRTAARPDLRLVAVRQPRLEAQGYERHCASGQHNSIHLTVSLGRNSPLPLSVGAIDRPAIQIGEKVVSRRAVRRSVRQRRVVMQKLDDDPLPFPLCAVRRGGDASLSPDRLVSVHAVIVVKREQ